MESVTAIASAIATYILPEALKEGGKALGKGVSQMAKNLKAKSIKIGDMTQET